MWITFASTPRYPAVFRQGFLAENGIAEGLIASCIAEGVGSLGAKQIQTDVDSDGRCT
jgi:hypothetical protein